MKLYDNIKKRREELRMTQGELAAKTGYADKTMISKIENGNVDLPQSKIFNWLLKKHGIPHYRFHDLRHFCVSYLKAMGVEDLYIAQRTGHADYAVLRNVYAHTLQDHQKVVDEKILKDLKLFTA